MLGLFNKVQKGLFQSRHNIILKSTYLECFILNVLEANDDNKLWLWKNVFFEEGP